MWIDTQTIDLWEIYVPVCQTLSTTRFTDKHHRQWDNEVIRLTGGLTLLKSIKGKSISVFNGQTCEEEMIPVRIAADIHIMVQISIFTAKHYSQESVFYYKVSDRAMIYTPRTMDENGPVV